VQLRHLESLVGQIDAQNVGASRAIESARIPPPQPTSSTLHPAGTCCAFDPLQAEWIDLVQRAEFAFQVPPAVGEFGEFGQFCRIGIHGIGHMRIMKRRELWLQECAA
jgi:hypothetical protein